MGKQEVCVLGCVRRKRGSQLVWLLCFPYLAMASNSWQHPNIPTQQRRQRPHLMGMLAFSLRGDGDAKRRSSGACMCREGVGQTENASITGFWLHSLQGRRVAVECLVVSRQSFQVQTTQLTGDGGGGWGGVFRHYKVFHQEKLTLTLQLSRLVTKHIQAVGRLGLWALGINKIWILTWVCILSASDLSSVSRRRWERSAKICCEWMYGSTGMFFFERKL